MKGSVSSPLEDQHFIIDRFHLQGRVLSVPLQALTVGGQTLSVVDPPRQPRQLRRHPGKESVQESSAMPPPRMFMAKCWQRLTYMSTGRGTCWPGTRQSCRSSQARRIDPEPVSPSCLLVGVATKWRAGAWTGPAAAERATPERHQTPESEKADLTPFPNFLFGRRMGKHGQHSPPACLRPSD